MLLVAKLRFPGDAKDFRYASSVATFNPLVEIFKGPAQSTGESPAHTTLAGAHEADQYNRPDIVRTPFSLPQVSLLFYCFSERFLRWILPLKVRNTTVDETATRPTVPAKARPLSSAK